MKERGQGTKGKREMGQHEGINPQAEGQRAMLSLDPAIHSLRVLRCVALFLA